MEENPVFRLCKFNLLSESKFIIFRQMAALLLIGIFANFMLSNENLFFGKTSLLLIHAIGILSSIAFGLNFYRKFFAIVIIIIFSCTLLSSPFSMRVYPGYINYYLIYTLFVRSDESRFLATNNEWRINHALHVTFILVIAFSFTYSGITKLSNESWINGAALSLMKENPRFDLYFSWFQYELLLKIITWAVLGIELSFFPLYCFRKTRKLAIGLLSALFIGLLLFTKIPIVIICMLIFIFYCHESGSSQTVPL